MRACGQTNTRGKRVEFSTGAGSGGVEFSFIGVPPWIAARGNRLEGEATPQPRGREHAGNSRSGILRSITRRGPKNQKKKVLLREVVLIERARGGERDRERESG